MFYRKTMQKKKYIFPYDKKENMNCLTSILDCEGNNLTTGDFIAMKPNYKGLFAYSVYNKCYGLFYGCWYLDKNIYNPRCYGKFIEIPKDNGMRMEISIIRKYNEGVKQYEEKSD